MAIVLLNIEYFNDPNTGKPLSGGSVYIGQPDLDPKIEANRITVTIQQEDGSDVPIAPSAQPITLDSAGRFQYLGSPVQVSTTANYSIRVDDTAGAQKYYNPDAKIPDSSTVITRSDVYIQRDTVALMVADTTFTLGDYISVSGRIVNDDGGGNNYEAVPAGTAIADGGLYIDLPNTTPALQAKGLFQGGKYNIRQWGADPGNADNYTEIQAAIDYVQVIGKRLDVPEGIYLTSGQLRISRSMYFVGVGRGEENTAANPSEGVTTIRSSAASGVLFVKSLVASEWLYNPIVKDMCLDCNNLGAIGLNASSTVTGIFKNLIILRATADGMLLDDGNGVISLSNEIDSYTYNATANAAAANSNGLSFSDKGAAAGVVQSSIKNLSTNTADGDGLRLGGSDNNTIFDHHGFIQPGGTGYSVIFTNGITTAARNNTIYYLAGGNVKAENATYGNRIHSMTSEAGSISIDSGGQLHYEVFDYVNSDMHKTHSYRMDDKEWTSVSGMQPDGLVALSGLHASLWSAIIYPDSSDGWAVNNIPMHYDWNDGNIIGIDLVFSTSTANISGNVRIRASFMAVGITGATATPDSDQTFTVPVNDIVNRLNKISLVFATPVVFKRGDAMMTKIQRTGTDPLDTATGNFELLGINLVYQSDGPNSGGSGPFDIPPPYI